MPMKHEFLNQQQGKASPHNRVYLFTAHTSGPTNTALFMLHLGNVSLQAENKIRFSSWVRIQSLYLVTLLAKLESLQLLFLLLLSS
jgi:hypothetical protein